MTARRPPLERFRALAESYGAALERWPAEARGEAAALLRESAEARAILGEARVLDEAIAAASREGDAVLWAAAGGRDAALARLRSGVEARIAAGARAPARGAWRRRWDWVAGWAVSSVGLRWAGAAAGGGVAVAAGLLIGAMYAAGPATAADNVFAILQPAPIHILAE